MEHHKIMTEEEAETLDTYFTDHTVMPKPGKPGVLTRMGLLSGELDPEVTEYLRTQAAVPRRRLSATWYARNSKSPCSGKQCMPAAKKAKPPHGQPRRWTARKTARRGAGNRGER